jgi:Ca-activated chloride channel family protein
MRGCLPVLLLLAASLSGAQQPMKVEVNLVNVGFSVRDARGALVSDLAGTDVEVFEDAVPQKVAFFARSLDVPLTLGLLLDFSGSQEHSTKKHKHDMEVFLNEVLGPKDRAFLVCFGNHLRLAADFTPSAADVIAGLERYEHDNRHVLELGPREQRELGTAFYDAIYYSVEERLARQEGRRALLVFSDGEDNSSSHDMMSTIEVAQTRDVRVFTIRYTEKSHGHLTARNQYGIRVMDRMAKETGGAHIDAALMDPQTYFQRIGEELRSSYELAYYPTNTLQDDTFRRIVIQPKRPGLKVRAKTGYFAR